MSSNLSLMLNLLEKCYQRAGLLFEAQNHIQMGRLCPCINEHIHLMYLGRLDVELHNPHLSRLLH